MEREILFRGKQLEIGAFAVESVCEWVYGGYAKDCSGTVHIYDPMRARRMVRVDPSTVGQYTGLTDKAGKRIFEGDIIRGPGSRMQTDLFVIRWSGPGCGFTAGEGKRMWPNLNQATVAGYEVVGNVYDNPELLKEAHRNEQTGQSLSKRHNCMVRHGR